MVTWEWKSVKQGDRDEEWKFKSSYLLSQDHAEVNLYGIAARYIVTVVSKKIWELQCNSHTVTIQWVHMIVDPLQPIKYLFVHNCS